MASEQPGSGAAQRRRQRRLRSWLRHERMTVAMALAESTHHSSRGQTIARAGVWWREMNYTATVREPLLPLSPPPPTPTPQLELFSLCEEEPGGVRLDRLFAVSGPQELIQRHTVDQIVDAFPGLPTLDALVPLMVEQLVDVLHFVDALVSVAKQVNEVPKIILENIPSRRSVREPQLAEQWVESLALVPAPRMEDQLVEVPPIVTHIVPQSFFVSTDGYVWSQLSGLAGVYWWRCGTSHPVDPPPGCTARPGRDRNTGPG